MADVKWIKIATDIFDDEKILLIESMPDADALIVIWLKLLVQAGKCNTSGVLIMSGGMPYTDEMLATIFRRPLNTIRLALKTFERFGMIEYIEDVIALPNWEKHQSLDQLEKRREYMKNYMREKRQKQKALVENVNTCKPNSKTNVSDAEQETDIDKELNSSSYTDIWKSLSTEQIDYIESTYREGSDLIQAVYEEVKHKRRIIEKPFEYVIGYAENRKWSR